MIQIKSRFTQKIIHEGDFATIKDCVEDAVQKGIRLAHANLENANLGGANLENANLTYANLAGANLTNANLRRANLACADLENANLAGTNLYCANLRDTNLADANLENACLYGANLRDANLVFANLKNANLENADLAFANLINAKMPDKPITLPPTGETIIGFKKLLNGVVIKVEIPADADRVTTWKSRKCRASALRVIEVMQNPDNIPTDRMPGWYNQSFIYKLGELHFSHEFDSDERDDCRPGLHFFMTLEEAKEWQL
jgi:hypothetical protein